MASSHYDFFLSKYGIPVHPICFSLSSNFYYTIYASASDHLLYLEGETIKITDEQTYSKEASLYEHLSVSLLSQKLISCNFQRERKDYLNPD